MAEAEGQPLADLLPDGFIAEVKAADTALGTSANDRALQEADAHESTKTHHTTCAEAKAYCRQVARRCSVGKRVGNKLPDELIYVHPVYSTGELTAKTSRTVELLKANAASVPGKGIDELVAKGERLVGELRTVDSRKEQKRYSDLPKAVQDYYFQKGLLYLGLKAINDAAQALHADDTAAAARFNLNLLNRKTPSRKAKPAPAPVGA